MRTKYPLATLQDNEVTKTLASISDSALEKIRFSFPLFSHVKNTGIIKKDEDGFPLTGVFGEGTVDLSRLQQECWNKFEKNPQISSHVRDIMGRMAGWGFGFYSAVEDIQQAIDEVMEDPRNDLVTVFPKFVGRAEVEGELFLMLTAHEDGFIEVDFIAPDMLKGCDRGSGVIFHPMKQTFPLFYNIQFDKTNKNLSTKQILVPSINIAYFPELEETVKDHSDYKADKLKESRPTDKSMKKKVEGIGGYNRFIVRWDRSFLTRRNVSWIRTTIEWLNYYEDLKKYEIDHKKSSGAYLWVIKMEDVRAFRSWLSLSADERASTGIMAVKEPGGTLVLPPGMSLQVENPKLPSISDQDTDLLNMVASGLNKPQDYIMGDYKSTYASVKAAHGPQSDRINDDLSYFKTFLIYHLWRPVFYLKATVSKFKLNRRIEEVVDFENQKQVTKTVTKPVWKLMDVALPMSKLEDIEAMSKAMLGSKHGSLVDQLGIPLYKVAQRLGFYNYRMLRLHHAAEEAKFPKLKSLEDMEAKQEGQIKGNAEPAKKKPSASAEKAK